MSFAPPSTLFFAPTITPGSPLTSGWPQSETKLIVPPSSFQYAWMKFIRLGFVEIVLMPHASARCIVS